MIGLAFARQKSDGDAPANEDFMHPFLESVFFNFGSVTGALGQPGEQLIKLGLLLIIEGEILDDRSDLAIYLTDW